MSKIDEKSPKHCAKKEIIVDRFYRKLFYLLSTFLLLLLSVVFLLWFMLRPTKPQFSLKQVEIHQIKLIKANTVNCSVQLKILSKNPNRKVGIYYEELQVYASYKGQRITDLNTSLEPFYQGHEKSTLLSASLVGSVVHDKKVGRLVLNLKVKGQLRWKVGTWVSGKHQLDVNCIAFFMPVAPSSSPSPALSSSATLHSKQGSQCSTTF